METAKAAWTPAATGATAAVAANSAGFGIDRGWAGPALDLVTSNTFEDVAWCLQSAPHNPDNSCPTNPPCQMQ